LKISFNKSVIKKSLAGQGIGLPIDILCMSRPVDGIFRNLDHKNKLLANNI